MHDPEFNDRNFLIHDNFFAKGVRQVRPGGFVVFITSKGTLDKQSSRLRDYLADKADFLGAIRLPNTAFKQNANTEVTTDIVFLRRLADGEKPTGPAWLDLSKHIDAKGKVFHINEYFAANPEMMLGTMANTSSMYRANEPTLESDGRELGAALLEAVERLPRGVYRELESRSPQQRHAIIVAPDFVKENAFTLHDGAIAVRTGATLTVLENMPEETGRRIRALMKLRDAVREVLRSQLEDAPDAEIANARWQLNYQYDTLAARFGPVNNTANRRAFRADPDCPLLCSLEDYNDETKRAEKTSIFRERTIQNAKAPRAAETPKDALILSLNETGRVDLEHIESLLGRPPEQFLPELNGLIFRNPQTGNWETDDDYLSGDVRAKLADAKVAAERDAAYSPNVAALEAVQPADLTASEIDARLGAAWIPSSDVQAFACSLLGSEGVTVSHSAIVGTWFLRGDFSARCTVANTTEWGTDR